MDPKTYFDSDFLGTSSSLSASSLSAAVLLGSMSATHHDYLVNGSGIDNESNVIGQMTNGNLRKDINNLSESTRLARENILLRQIITNSHQKHALLQEKGAKLLKTFYNMFIIQTADSSSQSSAEDMSNLPNLSRATSVMVQNSTPGSSESSSPPTVESLIDRLQFLQTCGRRK